MMGQSPEDNKKEVLNFYSRRDFIHQLTLGLFASQSIQAEAKDPTSIHISSNQYSWTVYLAREGKDFMKEPSSTFPLIKKVGLNGLEPIATSSDQLKSIGAILQGLGLQMRSIYVNGPLHEKKLIEKTIARIREIAATSIEFDTKIIVINPDPLDWEARQGKTDSQITLQAEALNKLGAELKGMGLTLAYHYHHIELLNAAREFHHMMIGTDPALVTLCLDAHWIYRGAGNSFVALMDITELYAHRISEVHLRQSNGGIWSEVFTAKGDIDYIQLFRRLKQKGIKPHLVLEQAVEKGTPHTLSTLQCFEKSVDETRQILTWVLND